ncbi:hypothetical protein O181_109137 [Austropuccinia psidii MF-1]|uniref:Transcription factor Pcc1 n=1 Tax=Austropuccinia psidii MF-1 TaxID=1389203 RepID=A0A9Q3PR45_9BASI|nr:hypothetical protein [Austropuccinia psidii MF-1]
MLKEAIEAKEEIEIEVPETWHKLKIEVPILSLDYEKIKILIQAISIDQPLKFSSSKNSITRSINLIKSQSDSNYSLNLIISSDSLSQARVNLNHLLSDLDLILEVLEKF